MEALANQTLKAVGLIFQAVQLKVPVDVDVVKETMVNIQGLSQAVIDSKLPDEDKMIINRACEYLMEALPGGDLAKIEKGAMKLRAGLEKISSDPAAVAAVQGGGGMLGGLGSGIKKGAVALLGIGGIAGIAAWMTNRKRQKELELAMNPYGDFDEDEEFDDEEEAELNDLPEDEEWDDADVDDSDVDEDLGEEE
jgi:hypothetical protein